MADAIQDPEFAELVRTENLFGLNYYCEERFVPNPQISLQSPKQLSELMYEALGLPVRVRGKVSDIMRAKGIRQGNPSANESAITHALVYDFPDGGETAEFLKNVLEAKSCLTEDGLFYRPYENFPHWDTGLVHSEFSVASQKSGRGTAKHPNDAQVSKESGIREIYVPYESEDPDDPYLWISCDISSQEILLMAELSQDENMLSCFRGDNKRDVHSITGAAVYNLNHQADPISYEEFFAKRKTDPEVKGIRKDAAKRTNFGVNYDISAKGLALQLLISEERAQAMIDAHAEQFPGVHKWKEDMAKLILEQGYGVDLMGRRRHVGYVLDGSWKDAGEARSAVNSLIQGPGAEQIKLIINKLWKSRVYERYPAYFFGTVHDEILSICRRSAVVDFLREKHAAMIQPFADLVSRFSSTISIGPNFGKQTEVCEFFDEAAIKKFLKEM
jgi:DNA polymerase-1